MVNANKISLSVKKKKTELVIFKTQQKKFEGNIKIRLNGKIPYVTKVLNIWL